MRYIAAIAIGLLLTHFAAGQYIDPAPKPTLAPVLDDIEAARPAGAFAYIVMRTADYCLPCKNWKRAEMQHLRDRGWQVIEREPIAGRAIPEFTVVIGQERFTHVGYMTRERLQQIVNSRIKR
jgi:hypothetical protein